MVAVCYESDFHHTHEWLLETREIYSAGFYRTDRAVCCACLFIAARRIFEGTCCSVCPLIHTPLSFPQPCTVTAAGVPLRTTCLERGELPSSTSQFTHFCTEVLEPPFLDYLTYLLALDPPSSSYENSLMSTVFLIPCVHDFSKICGRSLRVVLKDTRERTHSIKWCCHIFPSFAMV